MVGPEPTALPLGESPTVSYIVTLMRSFVQFFKVRSMHNLIFYSVCAIITSDGRFLGDYSNILRGNFYE